MAQQRSNTHTLLSRASWLLLPRGAVESVKQIGASVRRTVFMVTGKSQADTSKAIEPETHALIEQGKAAVAQLSAYERFALYAYNLNIDDTALHKHVRMCTVIYRIRLAAFWVGALLLPTVAWNFGTLYALLNVLIVLFFGTSAVREYGYLKQLQDRALWGWAELKVLHGGLVAVLVSALWPLAAKVYHPATQQQPNQLGNTLPKQPLQAPTGLNPQGGEQ